ncbi:arsenite methyltransferase-like [Physella acuta]|uniref:arsenite methyltransferase-like n=1 Tax=Physella acuta TaxID=109671 RepID=UPI0027DBB884|nr:arsenite methyltransferase-like [Physella acuta]
MVKPPMIKPPVVKAAEFQPTVVKAPVVKAPVVKPPAVKPHVVKANVDTTSVNTKMDENMSQKIIKEMYFKLYQDFDVDTRLNIEAVPSYARNILLKISERTRKSYDGSSFFIPDAIEGARVLDIGCGGGSLSFVLSKLVGPAGYVVGVDFSEESIKLCQEETAYHMKEWGYSKPNCECICTYVEKLLDFQLEPFDVIV